MEVMNIINPIINPIESVCGPCALFIFQCADMSELKGFILILSFFSPFFFPLPGTGHSRLRAKGGITKQAAGMWSTGSSQARLLGCFPSAEPGR